MGYCMQLRDANFKIKNKNIKSCLEAIKKLDKQTNKGSGYSAGNFAWVNTNDFVNAKTIQDAFKAWRWEIQIDNKGNVNQIYFKGEKLGDDEFFFNTIAPYVESGSFIEMSGEDEAIWRWSFKDGKCINQDAIISWKE